MKTTSMKKLLAVAVLFCGAPLVLATGCAPTAVRAVTHVSTWGDYMYIAYAENQDTSKVQLCTVNADNSITCVDQDEVNRLLNNVTR